LRINDRRTNGWPESRQPCICCFGCCACRRKKTPQIPALPKFRHAFGAEPPQLIQRPLQRLRSQMQGAPPHLMQELLTRLCLQMAELPSACAPACSSGVCVVCVSTHRRTHRHRPCISTVCGCISQLAEPPQLLHVLHRRLCSQMPARHRSPGERVLGG
jgi:hypothetical protein